MADVKLVAVLDENSDILLWDIYVNGAWAGSRRTFLQAKARADHIVSGD